MINLESKSQLYWLKVLMIRIKSEISHYNHRILNLIFCEISHEISRNILNIKLSYKKLNI